MILRYAFTRDIYKDSGPDILDALAGAQRFNRWMADTIQPYIGKRVLETGAGIGNLTRILSPRRERYIAGDIDPEYLARLRARFQHRPEDGGAALRPIAIRRISRRWPARWIRWCA